MNGKQMTFLENLRWFAKWHSPIWLGAPLFGWILMFLGSYATGQPLFPFWVLLLFVGVLFVLLVIVPSVVDALNKMRHRD